MKKTLEVPENFPYINDFTVRGTCRHISITRNAVIIQMTTLNPFSQKINNPSVFIFDKELFKRLSQEIRIGDRVTFYCHITTTTNHRLGTIEAYDFQREFSYLEANFQGLDYVPDENVGRIQGIISSLPRKVGNSYRVSIATRINNSISFIPFSYYETNQKIIGKKKVGDEIRAVFSTFTFLEKNDGKSLLRQIYTISLAE